MSLATCTFDDAPAMTMTTMMTAMMTTANGLNMARFSRDATSAARHLQTRQPAAERTGCLWQFSAPRRLMAGSQTARTMFIRSAPTFRSSQESKTGA
jgi:hypothetical protein